MQDFFDVFFRNNLPEVSIGSDQIADEENYLNHSVSLDTHTVIEISLYKECWFNSEFTRLYASITVTDIDPDYVFECNCDEPGIT